MKTGKIIASVIGTSVVVGAIAGIVIKKIIDDKEKKFWDDLEDDFDNFDDEDDDWNNDDEIKIKVTTSKDNETKDLDEEDKDQIKMVVDEDNNLKTNVEE